MKLKKYLILIVFIFQLVEGKTQYNNCSDSVRYELIIPTFLGNKTRNYYGNLAPDNLNLNWKHYLGSGKTIISSKIGAKIWSGAGWTGQPLLVKEDSALYLIQGAYDHNLKKINAQTGKIVWQYKYDDVIKGTGTIWEDTLASDSCNSLIILQGSRLGNNNSFNAKVIPSYRAISYFTGKELWRLNVKHTRSYSRDVDGSALIVQDTAFIGLENGLFTVFNPRPDSAKLKEGILQPSVFQETYLYKETDVILHRGNLVTESSPCILNGIIYIASGSGHIYGYDIRKKLLVWDFFIGSDIDGSAIVTKDSCLLVSVEKQYIKGKGGIFKLDPSRPEKDAVIWYFPVENKNFASWEGGVIGSVGINDSYNDGSYPNMAVFSAIDGNLYVVNHTILDSKKVLGPDNSTYYPAPKLIYKKYTGSSISTPLIVNNKIIAAGYGGIFLFKFNNSGEFQLLDKFISSFESTPAVYNGKIYIASRDGYLYCLGKLN